MKKTLLPLAVAIAAIGSAGAQNASDPVLMTINGKPVSLSEFEYLYQKNNAQQLTTQPVDEYLELFINYKLKVAEAEAEGLDKSDAFTSEYTGYCRDLAAPYLVDNQATDSLVRLIYDRMGEELDVSHIMIPLAMGAQASEEAKAGLAALREDIIAGRKDFAAVADSISIDPAVSRNHGHMGFMSGGAFPYTFEDAAYSTAVGEISPVIETPFGYHIVKVNSRQPARGEVKVQHILKLTRDLTPEEAAVKKAEIDSIYTLVTTGGADFATVAMAESEDPGSARRGGELDWFGPGRMVPEFEQAAFALADGEISQPIKSSFGYHIIRRIDSRDREDFSVMEPRIRQFISRDDRQEIPQRAMTERLIKKYGATTNEAIASQLRSDITAAGTPDSAFMAKVAADNRVLIALNGGNKGVTVAETFATIAPHFKSLAADQAIALLNERIAQATADAVLDAERNNLANDNADYRNLLNEYRDGMLLFEISDRNVWSRAKTDRDGLNKYFADHRKDYTNWTAPKFKGFVIFFTSDSLMREGQQFLQAKPLPRSEVVEAMRARFGKDVRVERVIAAQGENAIIDAIAFGGEKPAPASNAKWAYYFPYDGKIIDQPEEPDDVRGQVTTDYQNYLEEQWVKQLRKKYPVKVDRKVLKQYEASLSK